MDEPLGRSVDLWAGGADNETISRPSTQCILPVNVYPIHYVLRMVYSVYMYVHIGREAKYRGEISCPLTSSQTPGPHLGTRL